MDHPAEAVTKSEGVTAFKECSAEWTDILCTKPRFGFLWRHVVGVAGNSESHRCNGTCVACAGALSRIPRARNVLQMHLDSDLVSQV